jgi:hypothetical protein
MRRRTLHAIQGMGLFLKMFFKADPVYPAW